jgi:Xaa-Pro aminopeptidase
MTETAKNLIGLTVAGCRKRQHRLAEHLRDTRIDAALVCDPRHVYYFTGYLTASHHASLVLVAADGSSHLVLPAVTNPEKLLATEISEYESHRLASLVEDQFRAVLRPIEEELAQHRTIAIDCPQFALFGGERFRDLAPDMLEWRRSKGDDEIATLRHAVRACEAGYARAAEILRPGIREIDVYAKLQAAAIKELGEPIGEFGNDFQAGSPGGPPRDRPVERGELMPLDVGVSVRRYRCDLCRTFAVGNEPSPNQREAASLVEQALLFAEERVCAGVSCRQLFEDVKRELDGKNGWRFPHHLGHGIGLSPHEAPYLNPNWDDHFAVGDVFTIEPGLYHDDLRAGVRIELKYWLAPGGLVRLSSYPTHL